MSERGDVLVRVEHVSKKFCRDLRRSLWYGVHDMATAISGRSREHQPLRRDEFWAVNDASLELRRGECLGLIGHNGAGKTTLLKMLNGLITPDRGRISIKGRIGALIALGAGFNPVLTGRENTYVNAAILGLSKRETDRRLDEIIDFAEIRDFIDAPLQNYSSGMAYALGSRSPPRSNQTCSCWTKCLRSATRRSGTNVTRGYQRCCRGPPSSWCRTAWTTSVISAVASS